MSDTADMLLLTGAARAVDVIRSIDKHMADIAEAGGLETPAGRERAARFIYSYEEVRGDVRENVLRPLNEAIRMKAS